MAEEEKFEVWVHVKITEKELSEQLDAMVSSDQLDRSKMMRRLIRQEWLRRNSQAHWVGASSTPISANKKAVKK